MANIAPGSSPSPSKGIRKLRTLEDLASEGWDTQDFISEVCCVDTVDLSRIPSPLADLADRVDELKHVVDNHVHPQVSFLFNCIQGKDTARLISYLDEGPTGAFGAFQADHMGPHFFIVPPDTPEILLPLNRRDGTIGGTHLDVHVRKNARTDEIGYFIVNKQRNLFINENLIARKSAAGPLPDFAVIQIGYWVMFWWCTRAAMDYRPMALWQVSSIENSSDHSADVLSQGVKEVEEVDATKESPPTPPNSKEGENSAPEPSHSPPGASKGGDAAEELSSSPTSGSEEGEIVEVPTRLLTPWKETLYFHLRRHDNDRVAAGDRHVYHEIGSASGMNIDDVLFAVATIWKPLRNQGTDFAFAGADVFEQDLQQQVAAEILQSVGVVGEGNVFIMPLFFPPDQEVVEAGYKKNLENKANEENAKGKAKKDKARTGVENLSSPLGHLLLAVAERDPTEPNNINIQILDSLDGIVDPDLIRRRATEVARVWVGTEVEAGLEFHVVPQQTGNSNACGLYVILNAWMMMLGIPIRNAESRRGGCGLDLEFVKDGLKIVNLALAGFMDSKTIRAFLYYYGYTDLEGPLDPLDQEANTENAVIAARMDKRQFERALAELPSSLSSTTSAHRSDSTDRALQESPSPFSSTSSAPSTDTTGLQDAMSESSIQQFMEQAHDASLEEAKECLEATDGDIGEAIVLFAEHQSQLGGLAEAEGAPEC